jgi:hypothetical protein
MFFLLIPEKETDMDGATARFDLAIVEVSVRSFFNGALLSR